MSDQYADCSHHWITGVIDMCRLCTAPIEFHDLNISVIKVFNAFASKVKTTEVKSIDMLANRIKSLRKPLVYQMASIEKFSPKAVIPY